MKLLPLQQLHLTARERNPLLSQTTACTCASECECGVQLHTCTKPTLQPGHFSPLSQLSVHADAGLLALTALLLMLLYRTDLLRRVREVVSKHSDVMKYETRHAADGDYKADLMVGTLGEQQQEQSKARREQQA